MVILKVWVEGNGSILGENVGVMDGRKCTMLAAVYWGHLDVLKYLLEERGCDCGTIEDRYGHTALGLAKRWGDKAEAVAYLEVNK